MPQTSRFDNNQIESIMNDLLIVLENNNANKDLSLVVLGNLISHIINHNVPKAHRLALAETFSSSLKKSIDS